MTPEEKAKELVDKYYNFGDQEFDYSKEFALIAVEEIIKQSWDYREIDLGANYDYWTKVKNKIEQL